MPTILYIVFIVTVLPIVWSASGIYFRLQQFGKIDNNHPRQQQARLEGAGARTLAAQQNAWEALPVFLAAVFIAYAAGVDLHSLNTVGYVYLASRVLHGALYIANLATLRSLAFAVAMGCNLYIVYVAATVA